MVRFVCCCVVCKVSLYFYIAVCRGSSTDLQGQHSCNILVRCCSLLVRFASSSMCVGGLVVGPNWLSLSCGGQKCSCNCTRSLWGLESSLYRAPISLSSSCMLWVVGVVSREVVSLGQAFPRCHCTWQFDHFISSSWCEFCDVIHSCGAGLWKMTVHICGTSACRSMLMLRMRQKVTYQGKAMVSIMRGFLSVVIESSMLMIGECLSCLPCRYHWLFRCEVSHHRTSVKVQVVGLFSAEYRLP